MMSGVVNVETRHRDRNSGASASSIARRVAAGIVLTVEIELLEIRDFLAACHPFEPLPGHALDTLAHAVSISYLRRGATRVTGADKDGRTLDVVRSGAIEVRAGDGGLLARRGEGDCALLPVAANPPGGQRRSPATFVALEDTLLYHLPSSVVEKLCAAHGPLAEALCPPGGQRLRLIDPARTDARASGGVEAPDLVTTRLGDVVARAAVSLPSITSVREVAARMNEEHVTSMLLVDEGELVGIVTDRDLRRRVIVEGVDPERSVAEIMTSSPIVAGVDSLAHDALLLMARHGIHHLPVVDADSLVGVVTASDFVERRGSSTVRLAASIHRAPSAASLVAERERIDALYARMVRGGTAAARIGRVTSGVVDALTIRLLELAATEAQLAIPGRLVWLVAGSQARREWHIGSVAANGPLIEGPAASSADEKAAKEVARFVDDGLVRCGFTTLGAGVGGRRHFDADGWLAHITRWLDEGEEHGGVPAAALLDLRAVQGEHEALSGLNARIAAALRDDPRRLGRLARSALSRRPPLGFFRDAVLDECGKERAELDIAADAVRPIVDLARVFALVCGDDPLDTRERLVRAVDGGELERTLGRDLGDALDFAAGVRARQHVRRGRGESDGRKSGIGRDGIGAADRVSPASLAAFERHHLEDVFAIVRAAQARLAARHVR